MSVCRVKGSPRWYVRFTSPDGRRIFRSAGTESRREAEEYEAELKARLWREHRLGEAQATWKEAVVSWLRATQHRDREGVEQILRWLDPHLGHLSLREISGGVVHAVRDAKLAEGVKPGTVNRHLAVVSAVLHHARKRGWIAKIPTIPRMKEPRGRVRFLTREEARALLDYLRERPRSDHLVDMVEFSLATGLREANVTGSRWDWLHGPVLVVPGEMSKSGRPIRVPLNSVAEAVLERRRGIDDNWIFTYRGKRLRKAAKNGFYDAVAAMGWDDVTWHTLRHTWASWHVMAGTPLQVVMELGGWSSYQMVLRYAHLAPDHLLEYANNVMEKW